MPCHNPVRARGRQFVGDMFNVRSRPTNTRSPRLQREMKSPDDTFDPFIGKMISHRFHHIQNTTMAAPGNENHTIRLPDNHYQLMNKAVRLEMTVYFGQQIPVPFGDAVLSGYIGEQKKILADLSIPVDVYQAISGLGKDRAVEFNGS